MNGLSASANMPGVAFTFTTALTSADIQRWMTLGQKYEVLTGSAELSQVYHPVSG